MTVLSPRHFVLFDFVLRVNWRNATASEGPHAERRRRNNKCNTLGHAESLDLDEVPADLRRRLRVNNDASLMIGCVEQLRPSYGEVLTRFDRMNNYREPVDKPLAGGWSTEGNPSERGESQVIEEPGQRRQGSQFFTLEARQKGKE